MELEEKEADEMLEEAEEKVEQAAEDAEREMSIEELEVAEGEMGVPIAKVSIYRDIPLRLRVADLELRLLQDGLFEVSVRDMKVSSFSFPLLPSSCSPQS